MFDPRPTPSPTRPGRSGRSGQSRRSRRPPVEQVRAGSDPRPREALIAHVGRLTDDQLDRCATELAALLSSAQAELAVVLSEIERRELHGSWDCRSVERYAGMRCQISPSRAGALGVLGRAVHELPVLGAAVVSGELAADKAVMIARVASPASEAALVELAMHATVDQTRRICSQWRRVGADGVEPIDPALDADAARALDGAALGRVIVIHDDEGVEVRARFDHVAGAFVLAALDRITAVVRDERRDAAPADETRAHASSPSPTTARSDDPFATPASGASSDTPTIRSTRADGQRPASADEIPREALTTEQWRAQGLLRLFDLAAADAPRTITRSGFTAEVVVHVPVDALLDPTDVDDLPLLASSDPPPFDRPGPLAPPPDVMILEPRGIRLRRDAARLLVCDGGLHTVLESSDGDPLHLGRRVTSITPAQRRAVHARHRHCTWPGCTGMVVQLHHRHHRVAGGHDDIENLVPLCTHHHGVVHRRGITVGRTSGGELHFVRASGTCITTDAPFGRELNPATATSPPTDPRVAVADLRERQRALGIPVDSPLRSPQWRNDRFDLGDCIAAVLARRDAALRRTVPT